MKTPAGTPPAENPLEGARARLLALSQERGASLSSLSEMLGRNPSYLQQFIRKGSPRKLEEGDRATLAEFFGVGEGELVDSGGVKDKSYVPPRRTLTDYIDVPRLAIGASAGPGALPDAEEAFDATLE